MLDPDYIDQAGDLVGAVYGEIETDMLTYLSKLLLSNADAVGQRGLTAINLLAQTHAADLLAIIERRKGDISKAVASAVLDAIKRSDRADTRAMGRGARAAVAASRPRQVEQTIAGIAGILERDNVEMTNAALALWNRAVTEAAAKVNTGTATAERAIHEAVRKMMHEGIATVQYRNTETGRLTVRNRVDVAVRRHVRTQIAQDGARRTMQVCEDADVSLVEVSSHGGARPSHAKWQGRVYSLKGDVTVGGVRYKDFYRETGYGSVDGLLGANCRHSFGPWIPGTPRMYSPNQEHPSGLSNDEVYALTQKQRAAERAIRQTKRDLAAAKLNYDDNGEVNDLAEVLRLQDELKGEQKKLRELIAEANKKGKAGVLQRSPQREWAGDMPKGAVAVSAQSKKRAREIIELKEKCARKYRPVYDDRDLGKAARAGYALMDKSLGYNVVAHGTPTTVELLGQRTDHKTIADVIRARKDYDGGPVRLLSCSTGDDSGDAPCFAQRLADELGVAVTAPDDTVWVFPDGTTTVGEEMWDNTGSFKTFQPRGKQ